MLDWRTIFIAAVFALAGLVKGAVGLGLPTIAMGLLAIIMSPVEAAAIVVLPSFITNVWQMVMGPSKAVFRRLWPMMIGMCLGTWAGAGLMIGSHARYATALLGAALMLYAFTSLISMHPLIQRPHEPWLGPIVGGITGIITAATGIFVMPAVPYLKAIGLEKEDLVQALGLSFTVSTVALAIDLASVGALTVSVAAPTFIALAMACVGVCIGQGLRSHLQPSSFQRWFCSGLLLLGLYLLACPAV